MNILKLAIQTEKIQMIERQISDDRAPASDDRAPSSDDRAPSSDDRAPSSDDRALGSDDRAPASDDRAIDYSGIRGPGFKSGIPPGGGHLTLRKAMSKPL